MRYILSVRYKWRKDVWSSSINLTYSIMQVKARSRHLHLNECRNEQWEEKWSKSCCKSWRHQMRTQVKIRIWNDVKLCQAYLTLNAQAVAETENQNDKLADTHAHSHFTLHNYMTNLQTCLHSRLHAHPQLWILLTHHFYANSNSLVKCSFQSCSNNEHRTLTHANAQTLLTCICDLVISSLSRFHDSVTSTLSSWLS